MIEVKFYDKERLQEMDEKLRFAVIFSESDGKWVFCKHHSRNTYEFPGGKREPGESILRTARRELNEETGAIDFTVEPVCIYSVSDPLAAGSAGETESFGMLFYATITSFEAELHAEIEKIILTKELPKAWTYPQIQPKLLQYLMEKNYLN